MRNQPERQRQTALFTTGRNNLFLQVLFVFVASMLGLQSSAQLGTYTFTGANVCPNNATSVTTQPANAVFSNFSNVGSTCGNSSSNFNNSTWNTNPTIDLSQYNQFSFSSNTGYLFTLTSLSFDQFVSNNNSVMWELRSSIDNFSSTIATGTGTTTLQTPAVTLSSATYDNITDVTFRFYLMNMKNAGSTWTFDNVTLNGTVNKIPDDPASPTSNSPQCASPGVTLTRSGTPPAGVTWYWQTISGGTSTANSGSTYNVTSSGTYYLRARNNTTLIWSTGQGSLAVTVTPSVGTPAFTLGGSSTRCQGVGSVTYTATATNTTGITYSLDAASTSGGNTINATTGAVTYANGWSGTTTITASAAGCNGPRTATHTATVTATVGNPVFILGATSTRCQGVGTVAYTATATNSTGMAYSLDAASISGGNSINGATGAVTYVAGWSGTSVITASASGCNGPRTSNHTVTVTPTVSAPVFAMGTTSTRCQGATTISYSATAANATSITYSIDAGSASGGNTINTTTGAVTFVAGWSGTTVISAFASGCNGPSANRSHTVTINPSVGTPNFLIGPTSTRCQGAGNFEYEGNVMNATGVTYSLDAASIAAGNAIDETNGEVSFDAGYSGTLIITITATGCNGPKTATHTVTITPTVSNPVFTSGATTTRCQGANTVTYSASASNSTGITYNLDAASVSGGNTINAATGAVTYVASWSGTSTITASATGCNGPKTAIHNVTITPTVSVPVFSGGTASTRCQGAGTVTYGAIAANSTGITYSLDATSTSGGNTINATTGAVSFAAGWSGTSTITASASGCNGPATAAHLVTITPTVGTPVFTGGSTSTRCQGAGSVTYTAIATNNTGITYSLDAASISGGNSINSSTGEVTYTVNWSGTSTITATASGCNGPRTANHTVTTTPTVGTPIFSGAISTTRCIKGEDVFYTATASNTTGITYSLDAASLAATNTIIASTGRVTWTSSFTGTSVITATAAGCNGPVSSTITIVTNGDVGDPIFNRGSSSTRCQGAATESYAASAVNANSIVYTLSSGGLSGGNTVNSSTGDVTFAPGYSGTFDVIANAIGCSGPKEKKHAVTVTPSVSLTGFEWGASSTRCIKGETVEYKVTANNFTSISWSLDAASLAAGNTIQTTSGKITFTSSFTGTSVITVTVNGCNGPLSTSHTITTNGLVTTPVFTSGSNSTRCQGAGSITYTASANWTSGITYTLDNTSRSAGNTINAVTGEVIWVSGWSGTSTLTASAAGCSGPLTANHIITTTPTVGTPIFTLGASSTRCQASGTVTYTATATNNTGITYSLDAASLAAGNTINSANGAVTYLDNWSGSSVITASATGCNGPITSNHTVTITPYQGTPVFIAGASSSRCQASGSVIFSASASNASGITYTLDAASISGGNSINATTGSLSFNAGWIGNTTITATAAGCGPNTIATHTVTTNGTVSTPVFSMGSSSSRCQGAVTITYSATSNYTTGLTYSLNEPSLAAGNTINASTGAVTYTSAYSGTTIITASSEGCGGPKTAIHTVTVNAAATPMIFTFGDASNRCRANETTRYTAASSNSTGLTYSLDAASISAGITINSSNGDVTYYNGYTGTVYITATANGCAGMVSATHAATTYGNMSGVSFTAGSVSTRCQGANSSTYTASANNMWSISYELDNASLSGGNSIDVNTGAVFYVSGWTGTSTITATAIGCSGPKTGTHTITTTGTVATPVFALGNTSSRCQAAASVTYDATASNSTSISYSLDATSLSAGNFINSTSGVVTYVGGWSGTSTITATASGCNGPTFATHTVTITPSVGTPVFDGGLVTTRCQGAGTATYSATATTTTGITYSLDAASISGGNNINSVTGVLNFAAGYSGTITITASAAGCNGPKTASLNVNVTPTVGVPVFAMGASSFRCYGSGTVVYSATASTSTGMSYSLDENSLAAGNTINATTGAVTFASSWIGASTITATATGCNGPRSATHIVTSNDNVTTPVFAMGASTVICQAPGTITYTATANYTSGITYSLDGASISGGNTINATTGAVTYAAAWSGTTAITATAAGCPSSKSATHTVTITPSVSTPVYAMGATSSRCQGAGNQTYTASASNTTGITYSLDAGSLSAGNTINPATGEVSFVASFSGTAVITTSATGCNGPKTATHTITVNPPVGPTTFTLGAGSTRCQGAGTITYTANATTNSGITYTLDAISLAGGNTINAATGAVTFMATWITNSTVTATASGCGSPTSNTHTISITPTVGTPVFSSGASSTRCQGAGSVTYSASATNTTAITYTLDAASISGGNTINATTGTVTFAAGWSGTTTVTASAAGCSGPRTATHTVTITATVGTPVFGLGATSTRCRAAGSVTYTATATTSTGMSYSLDAASIAAGNNINTATGAVTYVEAWEGTSVITATATGCNGPKSANHTITITPYVGTPVFAAGTATFRCKASGTTTYTATATNATGMSYALDLTSRLNGNSINASTGAVTFTSGWIGTSTVTATATGCNGNSSSTLSIYSDDPVTTPSFSLGTSSSRCFGAGSVTYTATVSNAFSLSYSLDATSLAAGNTINTSTGRVTYVDTWWGTSVITATATGCGGPKTRTHTVTINPSVGPVVFSLGENSNRCKGGSTVTYSANASDNTGITYSLDLTSRNAGNTINSSTGAVTYTNGYTGTSFITATASGCNGPTIATHSATSYNNVNNPVFNLGNNSTRCQGADMVSYSSTANNAWSIDYSLDINSRNAGNTINSTTGDVTFVEGWSGTSTITASAVGCNGPKTTNHTVTTTGYVTTPVFTSGSATTRCQAGGSVTYSATASNTSGITYSLDATSLSGGNTINTFTGAVTYAAGWIGTSIITVNANGCNGPKTAQHTVTTTASVSTPVFTIGDVSTRCQGAESVIYTATATPTTGITYTLNAASLSAGNTIVAATGVVTYVATWSGTSTITASAAGCSGPKTATHTVTVTPTVGVPVFSLGASSTRCQGANAVTFGATATNQSGMSYALDATSLSAGNTINAATGEVSFVANYVGNSTITATATGCNGPKTGSHTIISNPSVTVPVFVGGNSSSRCQGSGSLVYTANASNATDIIYTLDNFSVSQGNLVNSNNGTVTFSAGYSGTLVITATAIGCNGPLSTNHTVNITPTVGTPVFDMGPTSGRCKGAGTITYAASAANSTSLTYSLDNTSLAAGNTINTATGSVTFVASWSGTSIITASAAGCNGPDYATHTINILNDVATPVFNLGASSTRCQGSGMVTYTANAANASGITYSLDATSLAAGNTINSGTGAVTFTAGFNGTAVITATAFGCGPAISATHTVTITTSVPAPVFTMGNNSSRCNGPGSVTYTATASTAITYSIDVTSINAGNTINTSTGALTFSAGWVGITTVTATATGCGNPSTVHTVNNTPTVADPVFNGGATSTRCQGAGSAQYIATASNSTGINYSLDAESLAAGNTINATSGVVTYVASWVSQTTITATATGCNGPASSTHLVSMSPNGTPTFALGAGSTRNQGIGSVTYTATSNNGAGVTYSLDSASLAAGNTINSSTGAVTYTSIWSGTSIIRANSSGCNGAVFSIHTVTIAPSSVFKHLYLSDPAQALDRIDPIATLDNTTAVSAVLANGGSTTFTQAPALCSQLVIKTGRNITITAFTTISSGTMPANPAITALLRYGITNIISLSNPTYNSGTGLLTWVGTLPSDVTVPANGAIALVITSAQSGVSFTIQFDSQTKPSKIEIPVSTYIDITALDVYNAPYPGGSIITGGVSGSTYYIRATVTDPFGSADITGLNLTLTPGGTVAATSVATSGCTRIYQYVWSSPPSATYVDIFAVAKEGFENTVTANRSISFSNCISCPPVALNDSAIGAGGTPIIMNVLANDSDPNNDINVSSLKIVSEPTNGNAIIANGKIVYLPNGTFAGTDYFTYQVCDLTSPTPLCATAIVKVTIDPTIVDPCSEAGQSHIYYIPFPEDDARQALIRSTQAANLPLPSNNIRTIISVKIPYPGMVIVWDHWEDGYETNILNPTQSTTQIWGDGNPYNGIAPGYPNDIIPAGGSMVFDNTMNANPRTPSSIFYDGKDKVYSSGEITLTQVLGEPSRIGLQAMKTNIAATSEFGKSFTIPVGEDFSSQDFRYSALFIRATENNTEVNIDKDNNGTFETTTILNEGQSLLVDGGVLTGATVTGSAPIGVDLHFGGVDNYSSREVPIFPATWYSNVYYTPVPTTTTGDTSVVMLYNNLKRPITINWSNGAPASGSINLPAKTVIRFPLANSTANAYKFVNPTGESFTAIEIVDSYTPGGGGNSGSTYDWSFNLIAEDRLTTFATIAWAPGSTDGTRNDNPIWVTPANNTTIYVKYNGEVLSGGLVSPCGFRYDVAYTLNALKYRKIFDNNDKDQSGIAIYTCDGTKIAAVYGEDPATAVAGNPSWDVGTTIKPYCAQKLIFANDDYAYSLTDQSVTIPVLNNDAGFTAVIDPATLSLAGLMKPKYGTVSINPNGTLLYTPNPGYIGLDSLQYSICSTPVPVCDIALVIINISGCPTPANQNIISGQVFLDRNKDGISNDGKTGFSPVKVYFYADGNCNGLIDANELKDSVTVDASGGYQFITYPERTIKDDFDGPGGTLTCATGTDGNTPWAGNWVDAGDASVGFCVTPAQSYGNTDVEMMADGIFGNALRLKDANKSATRMVNLSGASAAYLSFSYRKAKTSVTTGKNIFVQVSTNGSTFTTIYTIPGNGTIDAAYVPVYNQNILPYASGTTYIRFLTNGTFVDADEVFIDDVQITYLRYPMCYITAVDANSLHEDFYISTANKNVLTATNGGSCLFPFDYGIAKKIITVSGNLYNDGNGLTDNLVNGTAFGAPSGNTVYAYLVNSLGKVEFKTTVNGATGAYSFPKAEVSTNYTLRLSTTDVAIGANPPATANLPAGWVMTGDSYGLLNKAGIGIEPGNPDVSVPVNTGLFNVTNVDFGVQQRPTAGSGYNTAINPGFTNTVVVPANTFTNTVVSSDPVPGTVSGIRILAFPDKITTLVINGVSYTAATFPPAGVVVPATSTGQPTQTIRVDPVNGMVRMNLLFNAIDNAGFESLIPGTATVLFLLDSDKDGIPDNIDIDDDNDGIPDVIEVCGNGATSFACAPGGKDPAGDEDSDGIVNWQDSDYGPLNANGCNTAMDRDGDGVPDFLDLDSDNDGIPDVVEAFGADADGDGVIDNFTDTDGDGFSQNLDANNTGAAGSGNGLGFVDIDADGVPNTLDLDSDGDGLPDIMEVFGTDANFDGRIDGFIDSDFDGLADSVDGDANNDFIIENLTGPLLKTGTALSNGRPANYPSKNADYTGRPNPYDLDSDGDGIIDVVESGLTQFVGISNGQVSGGKTNGWANSVKAVGTFTPRNSDNRGPANYLDIDSDDDGITDNIEAQSTNGYIVPTDLDTDNDGIADVYDISKTTYGGNGLTPYDNDGDGTPDYIDTDTDNDGAPDLNEASRYFDLTPANINSLDTDGDGLLDEFDLLNISLLTPGNFYRNVSNSNFGPLGNLNGPLPSGSNAKMVKSAASMNDRDWRNIVVLPLQIITFNGTYQNSIVNLKWSVENESEVSHYDIERSANGIAFEKIVSVNARNQNNTAYSIDDDVSQVTSANVYYRLRQVGKTGETFVSKVIRWQLESNREQPKLYPNPVHDQLKVSYYAKQQASANVIIVNASGQPVIATKFNLEAGPNTLDIPGIATLHKGMYYLRLIDGSKVFILNFVVQ